MTDFFHFYRSDKEKKLLKPEEEKELGRRIVDGRKWKRIPGSKRLRAVLNSDARTAARDLARCNVRLVMHACMRYESKHIPMEDMLGYGCEGLCRATESWDYRKARFSTYAYFWIRQALLRAMDTVSRVVVIPSGARLRLRRATTKTRFKGKASHALNALRRGLYQELTLTKEYNPSDGGRGDPAERVLMDERREQLERVMKKLTMRQRDVITMRYVHGMKIKDISRKMRIPRIKVRLISRESLQRLRLKILQEEID